MKTHKLVYKKLFLVLVVLCLPFVRTFAQDATLGFPIASFTSTSINTGLGNEVIFSHIGASFSSASYTNCAVGASGNTMRVDNNTDEFNVSTPSGTINRIDITIQSNGTSAANAIIGFSADGTTWSNFQELAAPANNANPSCTTHSISPPAGMKYFKAMRTGFGGFTPVGTTGATFRVFNVLVYVNSGTPVPAVSPSPLTLSSLYYNTAALVDATGGNPTKANFTLTGANLTAGNNVTVTAPANVQISTTGTGGWSSSLSVAPTAGAISQVIYVRIDPAYTTYGLAQSFGNITFAQAEVASISSVALSGDVVNLAPLACPGTMNISNITYTGADLTWSNVANNNGYQVRIYNLGVQVGATADLAANTTSYTIPSLNSNTSYTARITVKGNGTSNGNSVECAAQAFTTAVAPPSNKITCWTEDFETLSPSANTNSDACPTVNGATTSELRYNADSGTPSGTNRCETAGINFGLTLPSGTWTNGFALGASGAGRGGSSRSLYMRNTAGTITLPVLDNPRTVTFYVYAKGAVTNIARGVKLFLDGTIITADIQVDDVVYTTADGLIRFGSAGWHKVSISLTSTTQNTIRIEVTGDSSMDIWFDDFTVECSSMLLEAFPDAAGMNYVLDIGPSAVKTFTITGSDLPIAPGNITLSNLGNFQLSFDNGTSWSNTASVTLPYTTNTFAQSVMVRLKAGLGVADYSTTVAFACPGYTKVLPTLNLSGKVTLLPQTLPCGEEVVLLNMRGTNEANILLDAVTGTNWIATSATKNNHFLLADGASLTSPTISLGEYELKNVTFSFQPTNATSMTMVLSCFGSGGTFNPVTFNGSQKVPYTFTQDLSSTGYSGNFYLRFTDGTQTDIEMWDIKVTGVPKRIINLSNPTLSGFEASSSSCPSEMQSLMVLGTCLKDNSSLDYTSSYYEFSKDGITWATPDVNNVSKLTYAGAYPMGGMKVYVRLKGTTGTTSYSANETVEITNAGAAATSLLLSGTVTPPADIVVPASVAFNSPTGIASIQSIPFDGGISCSPLVVTHNCGAGLTLSNCEGGTYAASASFAITDTVRALYLKYTPGANLNCTLTFTSGTFVKTVPLTWTAASSITNGVATDNTNLKYPAADGFGSVNVWKAGALPNSTLVTITSANFDVSMGNPTYGDFVATTLTELGDMNGLLYIRQKGAATSGTITLATAGGQTTTINVTVE